MYKVLQSSVLKCYKDQEVSHLVRPVLTALAAAVEATVHK